MKKPFPAGTRRRDEESGDRRHCHTRARSANPARGALVSLTEKPEAKGGGADRTVSVMHVCHECVRKEQARRKPDGRGRYDTLDRLDGAAGAPWPSCLSGQVSQRQCFAQGRVLPAASVASRGRSTSAAPELQAAPAATGTTHLEQRRWQSAAETWWLWECELAAHSGPGKQCLDVSRWEPIGKNSIDLAQLPICKHLYHQQRVPGRVGRCWVRPARSPCPEAAGTALCSELK